MLTAAAFLLALAGCQAGSGGVVRFVPKPSGPAAAGVEPTASEPVADPLSRPKISIDPRYTVIQVLNVNLDQDADEEQVIAVKDLGQVGSPVRLIVVDADPAQGTYYFASWDADTSATDSRVFSVAARDIIGDHTLQLVASGMNDAGKLTLDVYHLLPPSQGKGLRYRPVCQMVADQITVEDTDRPDSYATDQKPGASFPIIADLRDPDSENVMDLVRVLYTWNSAEGRYVPASPEKIPGAEVRQAQLKALFTSSGEQPFEQFISGSWVQVQPGVPGKTRDSYLSIIDFDTINRRISLSSGNTQEAYLWRESHRTIFNSMLVIGENETVLQIQLLRTFYITATDPNTITITIRGNDTDETTIVTYTRVDDDIRQKLLDRPGSQVLMASLPLAGRYLGRLGLTVDFQAPRLSWRDSSGQRTGTYVLFSLDGATILSARFGATAENPGKVTSWRVDYQETKDSLSATRTLVLTPVQLTVNGYQDANGDAVSLLQSQDLRKQ